MELLNRIQQQLKVPKTHQKAGIPYKYRSCEDILEAVKPLLGSGILTVSDEVVQLGNRFYVKATAVLQDGDESAVVTAYAREVETKPGTDEAKLTGAASSYARKYALNGLFCIDDTKDPDDDEPASKPAAKSVAKEEAKTRTQAVQEHTASLIKQIGEIVTAKAPELKTKEERGAWIKKQTGLSATVDNYEEVLVRLKAIA